MLFFKKIEEGLQTFAGIFVTLESLPLIGKFIAAIMGSKYSNGGSEISNTGKGFGENLIVSNLKNELDVPQAAQLEQLEDDLFADQDRGKDRLTAFQVYLAKLVKENSKQQKKTKKPKKDEDGQTEETSYTDLALEIGKKFVTRILAKPSYPERKKALEREGVFSEMPKVTTHGPTVEFARKHKFAAFGIIFIIIPSAIIYLLVEFFSSLL